MFSKKKVILLTTLFILLGIVASIVILLRFIGEPKGKINYAEDISQIHENSSEEYKKELLERDDDLAIGSKDARVTIVGYDSFTCPHCAAFYEKSFPELKSRYIDTGKVRFIHRDFPLDERALQASKLVKCYFKKNSAEKALEVVLAIYQSQREWAESGSSIEGLSSIFAFANFGEDSVNSCLEDENIENQVLEGRLKAAKVLKITGTPTFFINGVKLQKSYGFASIAEEIESILAVSK